MFSALRQGSFVYVLEKGDAPIFKIGTVVGVTYPTGGLVVGGQTVDISVRVGEQQMDFRNVPGSQSVASYNNAIITETKELMSTEVDNMLQNSRNIINSIDYHRNVISSCENILKKLNPTFAKEKERDEDMNNLKNKISGIEDKMEKIITLLSK